MARDLGNPVDVSRTKRRSDTRQRGIDNALKAMMEHKETRAWLHSLLSFCRLYESNFATSGLVMAHSEGQRNVGLMVLADIMRVAPQQYVLMLEENKEKDDDDGTSSEPGRASSERLGASDSLGDSLADAGSDA